MDGKTIGAGLVILMILAAVMLFFLKGSSAGNGSGSGSSGISSPLSTNGSTQGVAAGNSSPGAGGSAATASQTPYSNTQYSKFSYLISGNATLSAAGRAATTDVNITHALLANGSAEYRINYTGLGLAYNVVITAGEELYYIDTNTADDGLRDAYTGDEGYAVVNSSSGNALAVVYPLP